jgi:hypothetical protein
MMMFYFNLQTDGAVSKDPDGVDLPALMLLDRRQPRPPVRWPLPL